MSKKRIGVLTSGGDCPGLNAVLHGIVRSADALGWEVTGFRRGFEGLLAPGDHLVLDRATTDGIMNLGGTILETTNRGRFTARFRRGQRARVDPASIDSASATIRNLGIEALIVIGGDGSMNIALQLHQAGFPMIGVPKTIDNDIEATAITFGFDSAIACVADALDRLHTTADSHRRIMVLEVMGRHAGWIALHGGLAGRADIILLPEIPFDYDSIVDGIRRREGRERPGIVVVVAEGAAPKGGRTVSRETRAGEYRLGGVGDQVAREIARRLDRESRSCVLGHLQRGGAPTPMDRILGVRFGVHAVELVRLGRLGSMVSYRNDDVGDVPLASAVHRLRRVFPSSQVVQTARALGISFGDSPNPSNQPIPCTNSSKS